MPDSTEPIQVLITVKYDAESLSAFRDVSDRISILYHPARQANDVPDDVWAKAEVLYTLTAIPDPAQAPQLRWLHVHYAGVDAIMDQPIMQQEGLMVTTSSGIHATNIAEYVFMMMLAFGHRLPQMLEHQEAALWPDERKFITFMPQELRGSTVGIVGYGSIGREIARLAQAFGMEVLAIKRDVRQPTDPNGYVLAGTGDPEGIYFHRLYPPEALRTMVRDCDFVVITAPLTGSTRRMFDADAFAAMRKSAYLVNIGRGSIVDEEALQHALHSGQIAGAAMDVFESEPLPADSPLWKTPNLIISPHVSGNTEDYNEKAATLFIENLKRYLGKKELYNLVDMARGY